MAKKIDKKEKINNKLKVITAIIIFLLAVSGAGLVFNAFESISKDGTVAGAVSVEETAGLLIVTEGTATIDRNGAKNSYEAGEYDVLTGDFVETVGESRGYVIFSDNSSISLNENTKIQIQEQKHVNGNFVVKIEQLIGRTWSRVEKLFGGHTEYEVETPNTIAAVRGTEFDCDVAGENSTTCYAIVHDISVDSKVDENGEATLPEGEKFKNENGGNSTEKGGMPDDEWKEFNECLSENIAGILIGDSEKSIDFLKLNNDGIGCGEVLGETAEVVTVPEAPKPVLKSVTDDGVFTTVNTLNCKWSATNAKSYIYSLGTAAGKTDVAYWKSTTKNSSSSPSLPLTYGKKYFCNVIAKGDGGNSSMKSSDGIYYDVSSASFSVTTPTDGMYPYTPFTVSGRGAYSGLPLLDLELSYYVRSIKNGYCMGGGGWSSSVFWHYADITQSKGLTFNFGDTQQFGGSFEYEGVTFYFQLKNSLTGKVFGSKTVQLGSIVIK